MFEIEDKSQAQDAELLGLLAAAHGYNGADGREQDAAQAELNRIGFGLGESAIGASVTQPSALEL